MATVRKRRGRREDYAIERDPRADQRERDMLSAIRSVTKPARGPAARGRARGIFQ